MILMFVFTLCLCFFVCVCMFHWTQISESGSYAELLAKRGDFSDFIVEQLQGTEEETDEEEVKEVVT